MPKRKKTENAKVQTCKKHTHPKIATNPQIPKTQNAKTLKFKNNAFEVCPLTASLRARLARALSRGVCASQRPWASQSTKRDEAEEVPGHGGVASRERAEGTT